MIRFQVKVCGITRPQDARLAAELGADMIGIVLYSGSPRGVTPAQAKNIVRGLPPTVNRVGVFVTDDIDQIIRSADHLGLHFVQLHGPLPKNAIERLHRNDLRIIRAMDLLEWKKKRSMSGSADLVMIDTSRGTGATFEWKHMSPRRIPNFVLSGGISETNLARGIKLFRPLVVDVNSSIETSPGRKSLKKMRSFFARCNEIRYGA